MLSPEQRSKIDRAEDSFFYAFPRFVTHVDRYFLARLTRLYQERLQPQSRILDMMSSWVSHLPAEMEFDHVEGHGLNEEELAKNPRLDRYFVQDLNQNPKFPLPDNDFDAVLNCVSVQYLQYPEAVFSEIHRVLKPGGIAIISFSNRMFYQKAIALWRDGTEASRIDLVKNYFQSVSGFSEPEIVAHRSELGGLLQMLGMGGAGDPFYAAIAAKQQPIIPVST
jgi:SAM-dependent methyltransferase